MASYKVILPDKQELSFPDEKSSLIEASQRARDLNKILTVKQQEQDSGQWVECATVFPSGEIRRPVNIGAFADSLPMRRSRRTLSGTI